MSSHARMREPDRTAEGYSAARRAYALGRGVRDRRRELGLTQSQLARRAGMTQSAVSRMEAGGTTPTLDLLERLAVALDADLDVSFVPRREVA
ncbi:helix-turn-helix domain-containing protein [Allostreptomyces psammosilenae]|uniref:Transcriptional regulator with XRE-family HTH domain n=1 Tax=Allostreptomyces psammosilenae TaxID=1892865 RepID=A0A853A2A3_9ACTN|nr:helix-turn-helix transcriptional regulator [Allostreptomyces psammosilenae]NYI07014.1 transcriptional regulator with XRE-family HTH domain [Allostreptomyces psammosilenae]